MLWPRWRDCQVVGIVPVSVRLRVRSALLYTVWPSRELSGRYLDMCRYRLEIAALLLLLILTSCNEAPKASREEKAGGRAEPVTAKTAFWEMYKSSHSW